VDGKWVSDPANVMTSPGSGNSFLIINPNYTFLLKGFTNAKDVFLAGDFNDWDPKAYRMKKEGNQWIFPVHLSVGKHLYKFVVDGQWITDPGNKLWEQNEYSTGNSILWIEQ
jgi:1,4-alpha-glucan branching enzyme